MTIANKFAVAVFLAATSFAPAIAHAPAVKPHMTVKEYPLNFEGGGAREPITLYRHRGELAFVVIDSIASSAKNASAYRINIGSIARYDAGKSSPLGAYLPLRDGESVTVQMEKDSTLKLRAHVMVVTGYMDARI
jgi:hypothetical protein